MRELNQRIKRYEELTNKLVPEVYASIALSLHRTHGFGHDRIEKVFAESQRIWQDSITDTRRMIEICYDETGINVMLATKGEEE